MALLQDAISIFPTIVSLAFSRIHSLSHPQWCISHPRGSNNNQEFVVVLIVKILMTTMIKSIFEDVYL